MQVPKEHSPSDLFKIASSPVVKPRQPIPIILVGAGGIVRDAHLPAYRKAGYPVAAILDRDLSKAAALAREFGIPVVGDSIHSVLQRLETSKLHIYDLAVPANAQLKVLPQIPDGSAVLMQKPMGETLEEARATVKLCHDKKLKAAVNLQLRWSPAMLAARALYDEGVIGELHDIEVQVSTYMPWELWEFLRSAPRLEILYHSIHYVDLVRSWLGNPLQVYAKTVRNPLTAELAATKSVIILDYGEWIRAVISTNHDQKVTNVQHSYVQWEGTRGVMRAQMGVNLDYPTGRPDFLSFAAKNAIGMQDIPISGSWFPDAFIGSMGSLQRFIVGETVELPTSVESTLDTMRTVEAAYLSSQEGGTLLPDDPGEPGLKKQ